jgi:hypothetical protein
MPSRGLSGGLWLSWGAQVKVVIFKMKRYYMFAWVEERVRSRWIMIFVYGDASYRNNPGIWEDIKDLASTSMPLCCIDNFNAITKVDEKFGGK